MTIQTQASELKRTWGSLLPKVTPDHTPTEHFYCHDDKKYPSVSAPLGWIKGADLKMYSTNRAGDYVFDNYTKFTTENIAEHVQKMKGEGDRIKKEAGNTGSNVHGMRERAVELYWKNGIWPLWDSLKPQSGAEAAGIRSWFKFKDENNYEPVLCETALVDHKIGVGGSLDDVGFVNGELALVDLKTSNQHSQWTYFLQVSKYMDMLQFWTNYDQEIKLYILGVSKEKADYKLIKIDDYLKYADDFNSLFKLWQSKQSWKG